MTQKNQVDNLCFGDEGFRPKRRIRGSAGRPTRLTDGVVRVVESTQVDPERAHDWRDVAEGLAVELTRVRGELETLRSTRTATSSLAKELAEAREELDTLRVTRHRSWWLQWTKPSPRTALVQT